MSDVLVQLRAGDERFLRELYREHRDEFVHWIQRQYRFSLEDAKELFQLAVVIFYDNVMTGKLTELTSSAKSYIFSVGKNKAREMHRRGSRLHLSVDAFIYDRAEEDVESYMEEKEELFGQVERGLKQLSDSCRTLLTLFYYQKLSMEAICEQLEYSNAATAKNMKYKCMQRLKRLVQVNV